MASKLWQFMFLQPLQKHKEWKLELFIYHAKLEKYFIKKMLLLHGWTSERLFFFTAEFKCVYTNI